MKKLRYLLISLTAFLSISAFAEGKSVDCFKEATLTFKGHLDENSALRLCRKGGTVQTVECYEKATSVFNADLPPESALRLCQGPGTLETVECYKKATNPFGGKLQTAAAIDLCREGTPSVSK